MKVDGYQETALVESQLWLKGQGSLWHFNAKNVRVYRSL